MNCFFIYAINNIIYKMQIYHNEDLENLNEDDFNKVSTISISGYITNIYNTPIPKCNNLTILNIQCAKIPTFSLNNIFHSLKQLSLCRCDLAKFSIDLVDLSKLEHLKLSANNLKKIPKNTYGLTNLQSLWLDSNCVTKISKKIKNLVNLTSLRIQNNKLKKFPTKIYKLKNLEELMHSNKIDRRISQLYNIKYFVNNQNYYDGNIYVYKDCMLIYNYIKSPKFKIEIGADSSYDIRTKIDDYMRLHGRNKIMIEIPPNIKFLNILKTNLEYIDFDRLPEELEHLQIMSKREKVYEFNNYPYTLKKLSLINEVADSEGSSCDLNLDKKNNNNLKNKLKIPFGCEFIVKHYIY